MKMNDSNAVAALLMLDVASAKSTLSQLQFHCTAAFKEHQQLRDQLQDLQKVHLYFELMFRRAVRRRADAWLWQSNNFCWWLLTMSCGNHDVCWLHAGSPTSWS